MVDSVILNCMIRTIDVTTLIPLIRDLVIETNLVLSEDVTKSITQAEIKEQSVIGKQIFSMMKKNWQVASDKKIPLCQDTGVAVFFLEIGQDIHFSNGNLHTMINEGVKAGYKAGFLRKSIVADPLFQRINTKDNSPCIIHEEIVSGDLLKITFLAKGGGSENMSQLRMLRVSDGVEGIKNFVLEVIETAQGNPCPPVIVGIGIGGTFEKAALLSKKALLQPMNASHKNSQYAQLEKELLNSINKTGIGPQGLGGNTTALAVHILDYPCHIASLPVAVNIECHVHRHSSIVI